MDTILAVVTDLFFAVKVSDGAKRAGRQVKFARSLEGALASARENPVLIVVDLNCREIDPLALIGSLKADAALAAIPTLGFISHVQQDTKRAALAAGYGQVVARSTFSDRAAEFMGKAV